MLEVTVRRLITAPLHVVWAVLDDFGEIQRWSPGVKRSYMVSHGPVGVGSIRHCDFRPFSSARERIVVYEPQRRMTVALDQSSLLPLSNITADFRLQAQDGGTELLCAYAGTPNRLARVFTGVLQKGMRRGLEAIAGGLQHECERIARMPSPARATAGAFVTNKED